MKYKIYLFALLFMVTTNTFSQVGIGNPNPDSTSVLDLSNPNNKGLILPEALSQIQMYNKVGMLYSYQDNIFYTATDGFNAITPWKFKFNGDISNNVYYSLDGNIGIGFNDLSQRPSAPFHIKTNNIIDFNNNGSLLIGITDSTNMVFNAKNIQTRNNNNASELTINKNGGDVCLGSENKPVNLKISGKAKGLMVDSSSYYDYMPTGAICIWSGNTSDIPLGWGICDGSKYARSKNASDSIISPDLRGMFIVMAGDNGTHAYEPGDTGGQDEVLITEETLPAHKHDVYDQGHTHSYYYEKYYTKKDSRTGLGRNISGGKSNSVGSTGNSSVTIYENAVGGGNKHENRPPFYALVYIIKL